MATGQGRFTRDGADDIGVADLGHLGGGELCRKCNTKNNQDEYTKNGVKI